MAVGAQSPRRPHRPAQLAGPGVAQRPQAGRSAPKVSQAPRARPPQPMLAFAPGSRTAQGREEPQTLAPGSRVVFSGRAFAVTRPLGKGSFGVVWGARGSDGAVAIKEIVCKSEADLARVVAEGQLLKVVRERLTLDGGPHLVDRIPVLIASDVETISSKKWRVRLVMSEVPGRPLEDFLEARRQAEKLRVTITAQERRQRFAEACRCAGELVVQLAPVLEAFSSKVYHRDVTPRNIQVAGLETSDPKFGLVDFGLAVDAERWRAQEGAGDLSGDGRYWPSSAWFAFGHGRRQLKKHPAMNTEYRTCLDVHSLGLSAVRCFVELMPNLDLVDDLAADPWLSEVMPKFREIRTAWNRYWADARRFWQPVFDAFRCKGDFPSLRTAYAGAGVHRAVASHLRAIRRSIEAGQAVCRRLPGATAGAAELFEALLAMLQAPEPEAARSGCGPRGPLLTWRSVSTVTPGSSPAASPASSGSLGFEEEAVAHRRP